MPVCDASVARTMRLLKSGKDRIGAVANARVVQLGRRNDGYYPEDMRLGLVRTVTALRSPDAPNS